MLPLLESMYNLKPRDKGLTLLLDTGTIPVPLLEVYLNELSSYIDFAKLSSPVFLSYHAQERIRLYERFNIITYTGGTMFEMAYLKHSLNDWINVIRKAGLHYIEISNSLLNLNSSEIAEQISMLSAYFNVIVEIGSKLVPVPLPHMIKEASVYLKAGAWKVTIEECGSHNKINPDRLQILLKNASLYGIEKSSIIWEASSPISQAQVIDLIGAEANIANVELEQVLTLTAIRQKFHFLNFRKGDSK